MKKKLMLFEDTPTGEISFSALPDSRLTEEAGSVGAWEAQVWRIGVINLNGRVYTNELAQRIVADNRITLAYDGHDGDRNGDFAPVKAVCKNPFIKDGFLCVEVFITDEAYQATLEKISALGHPIGVSSVGYGETDEDGVVNVSTYELVRYLDFVVRPSGGNGATKKEDNDEGENDEGEGTPSPGDVEPSAEVLERVEILKRVQAHILERKNKC